MKILGIDFGLKRIGLATTEGNIASPLKIIEVKGLADAIEKVLQVFQKEAFTKIVVGLPEGKMGKNVVGFVRLLKKRGLEVETYDETLSSKRAVKSMIELGIPKKKRGVNDAYSAAIILQDYLDSQ